MTSLRSRLIHVLRLSLIAALVWFVHEQHRWRRAQEAGRKSTAVTLDHVRPFFPAAGQLAEWNPERSGRVVTDADGRSLGYVIQTSPASDSIVGYSGPTNILLAFDNSHRVQGAALLSSRDTVEHVAKVVRDPRFLPSLKGRKWDEVARGTGVDTVSGATLTSGAILEGMAERLGGAAPNLRFPAEVSLAEVLAEFPAATRIAPRAAQPQAFDVFGQDGQRLGSVLRTSPAADHQMGYQGPTDTLIALGLDERILGIRLRQSFDNEPYVGYVRDDEYFRSLFKGKSLAELKGLDPLKAGMEGVSGATMTSQAVARGIVDAAESALRVEVGPAPRRMFTKRDLGTVGVLVAAFAMCFTRLRGVRWLRVGFQLVLVGYLGFLNGDLLSQAQLVGWVQSGIPWRLAPGLALMTVAALVTPAVSKKQLYCHQVCPFGAAQQLVKLGAPYQVRLGKRVTRWLLWLPTILGTGLLVAVLANWPIELAAWEPFDAFFFWFAGWGTIAIAVVGLGAALFAPMAYCRYGCPTGALLNYLRYHSRSGAFTSRDVLAVLLVAFGWYICYWK